ncbi:MAG TPA: hypothetical protein VGG32_08580 [Thermoplasmata archaeon]|jgi:hypothetical protein
MSFSELLAGLTETDVAEVGNWMLPALMRAGIAEGLSGADMLSQFRDAGLGMRTQNFYGLLGEINDTTAMREGLAGLDPSLAPDADAFATWTTNRAEGYLYQIRGYFMETDPVTGALIKSFKPFDVVSRGIISGYQALGQAYDYIAGGGGPGSDSTLVGLEIVGLFQMVPGER